MPERVLPFCMEPEDKAACADAGLRAGPHASSDCSVQCVVLWVSVR